MCTLTYLPLNDAQYLLTSNRDESPLRAPARTPEVRRIGPRSVLFPVDGKAGGTWLATANDRRTVCLLNGAFGPHPLGGTYRLSRGVMVLESFAFPDIEAFVDNYDFGGIEPFTYVDFAQREHATQIAELRWDGIQMYRATYDAAKPQIWSSAQLYKADIVEKRKSWFQTWLTAHPNYQLADIQRFHQFGGEGDIYNDIRMNRRGMVQTVSTTAIENLSDSVTMHYQDLLVDKGTKKSLAVGTRIED
ncbi:MAG: NRDE family protein [Bacteroidota bacterium]